MQTNTSNHYPLPTLMGHTVFRNQAQTSRLASLSPALTNVSNLFKWPLSKTNWSIIVPWSEKKLPLALYFSAEQQLVIAVNNMEKTLDFNSPTFYYYADKVHKAQRNLLRSIYKIYLNLHDNRKVNKDYRRSLPIEEQRELEGCFSESILFAAQALCRGFQIRGIEQFSAELRDHARQLCAAMDALRFKFRHRTMVTLRPPYSDLFDVLEDFDVAWAQFEQSICLRYFSRPRGTTKKAFKSPQIDLYSILLSETLQTSIQKGLLNSDQLTEMDPALMLALPRLGIVRGLLENTELVDLTNPKSKLQWFNLNTDELTDIQTKLKQLDSNLIDILERKLACCDIDEDDKEEEEEVEEQAQETSSNLFNDEDSVIIKEWIDEDAPSPLDEVQELYVTISRIADGVTSSPFAPQLLQALKQVFQMNAP